MHKKVKFIAAALMAAALLIVGIVMSSAPNHAPAQTRLSAATAANSYANLDDCPTLAEGYHGGCVDQLQTELNNAGNAGLPVDGTFGATTQQAVIGFQQKNGVTPADGIVGPQTKQALTNGDSVQTPQPGAPLTPFQICQQQQPGSVSDGHGGCTSDGITAEGKSASECLQEAITDKANELIAQGATPEAAESAAAKVAEKLSLVYDAGSVFKCELLDNPDS